MLLLFEAGQVGLMDPEHRMPLLVDSRAFESNNRLPSGHFPWMDLPLSLVPLDLADGSSALQADGTLLLANSIASWCSHCFCPCLVVSGPSDLVVSDDCLVRSLALHAT